MTGSPAPARRRATRSRGPAATGSGLTAVALLAVAVVALALTMPATEVARPDTSNPGTLVTHSVVACPSRQVGPGVRSAFVAGAAPAAGLGGNGTVRQGKKAGAGKTLSLRRGQLLDLSGTSSDSVLTGDGQLAAGLFGFRDDQGTGSATTAVTGCAGPQGTWWFSGAGAGIDHSSELVLTNVDVGPALVDLRVVGGRGAAPGAATRGITIQPGTSRQVRLSDLAPQVNDLALGVKASRGRVVAAVADAFVPTPGGPAGREWLNGNTVPSREVRLAGLPDQADSRRLLVANPSDNEAVVEVRVAGRDGEFVPAGLGEQTIAPGAVASVDLGKDVGRKEAFAVRLRSQVPILATVRSVTGQDTTYAAPVVPLAEPAAAPVLAKGSSTVQLTAGSSPAKASVAAYDDQGARIEQKQLALKPTATTAWSPKKGAAYVVVTPVSGRVFGAAVYQGDGVSETPLTSLPIRYVEPSVVPAVH